ncbi:accessory gene regulator ArgB-like protein [Petroclostridium xylanilyticum]|uniref:accessory gene regulator ArgB-like protein n=1 Tax=Petroclostridium xylanilyticum TaxID=1792311 RepID=UPI001FA8356C|nr:accessory gene regulator B family protein [Petroclostridium xylanilyticum]
MILRNGIFMHNLIDIFTYKVYNEKLLSHRDLWKMKYAMTVMWYEVIKFVALLALFIILNKTYEFLLCISILFSIRIFSGGLHFESNFACFVSSAVFFCIIILYLPLLFTVSTGVGIVLMLISTSVVSIYSPMPSPNRPVISKKRRQTLKYLSVFFTLAWIFILYKFIHDHTFFEYGIWTISVQAFQLIIGKE